MTKKDDFCNLLFTSLLCFFGHFQAQPKVCLTVSNMPVTYATHLYCDVRTATGGLLIHLHPTFNKTYNFQFITSH